MARIEVRLYAERMSSEEPLDLGLHTIKADYDITEAEALQVLKADKRLGYSISGSVLEFAGAIIPLSDLKALRVEIVSRYQE